MKLDRILVLLLLFCGVAVAQANPTKYPHDRDFLPKNVTYDDAVPLPSDVLGSTVGEWHVRHDQLVQYMRELATASPRVAFKEIGRTHENRPLINLIITSTANHAELPALQAQHLANWQLDKSGSINESAPVVSYMGYGIHGDEPSGSNASLLVAYYLAAAQGDAIDDLLSKNIVVLDPSLNPDGLSRFAQWANSHRGKTLVADANHREHQQAWPSGRTNHYWFDLNRDWLLLTHPESVARVEQFQSWRPHILTDFHEMGSDSTYFFQPGVPSRTNPNTAASTMRLTELIGQYHANALDEQGQLYFTKEAFDDFYYGKGSSYPDAQGTIGILFEQASSRGHLRESINGDLTFAGTIANQVTTSLSTLRAATELRREILDKQKSFIRETLALAKKDETSGYVVLAGADKTRLQSMLDLLASHKIEVYPLLKDTKIDGEVVAAGSGYFVPSVQPQYRLVKSLFSSRKSFQDNTFYDVSNWNIAHAFNLEYLPVSGSRWRKIPYDGDIDLSLPKVNNDIADNPVAIAFNWHNSTAPALLQGLLADGLPARVSSKAFTAFTNEGEIDFQAGAVVLPWSDGLSSISGGIARLADQLNIKLWSVTSGLTPQGIDLGSRHLQPIDEPSVLLVGGRGTSQYEAGEVWHYLDTVVGLPVTITDLPLLHRLDLNRYSHIIFVDGRYSKNEALTSALDRWVRAGGVLIGQKRAGKWFADNDWLKATFTDKDDIDNAFDSNNLGYAQKDMLAAKKRVAGAVFSVDADLGHPLLFGLQRETMPVFRNSNIIMRAATKPFVMPLRYTTNPLMAGYASDEMQKLIAKSAMAKAHNIGKGKVIYFVDNVNFRGYWRGTRRMLSNAIYFSGFINAEG